MNEHADERKLIFALGIVIAIGSFVVGVLVGTVV